MSAVRVFDRLDGFQQRHAWVGFPWATLQKYRDDQGVYLAATIAYYGFFSLFPLLLVLTTILGWALEGHPDLRDQILGSALGEFPIVGRDLQANTLEGSGTALAVGLAVALWSGLGVVLAAQNAMNTLWGVPFRRRPDFVRKRGRALVLLLLLGAGVLGTTVLGSLPTVGASFGVEWKLGSVALSVLMNFGLFWLAFRVLTNADVGWRGLRGGAAVAAVAYEGLQLVGGLYVARVVDNASSVYGTFAVVIGLLSWIYLSAHILLLAAEGNVVATRRLWPRSLSLLGEQPATAADERALTQRAKVEERRSDEEIDVRIGDG
jgi:membrane protein